jgi:AcrR family transcriptional regulator
VTQREIDLLRSEREDWRARLEGVDPVAAGVLADLICEWLDRSARQRRVSAIVSAELILKASRDMAAAPLAGALIAEQAALWRDVLQGSAHGERLSGLISAYCRDEQPFSVLFADMLDYRLLRHSTVRALLRDRTAPARPEWSVWHMALVDRLARPAAAALDADDPAPQGMRARLAEDIADLIISDGVDAVGHRTVAQAAGVAVSSVAHHYPTLRDLVFGGVEALYRRMRLELKQAAGAAPSGGAVIRLTHETALAASRDEAFSPFAIDMRRRRAENVHQDVARALGIVPGAERPLTQAVVMAAIGHHVAVLATGQPPETLAAFVARSV